MVKPLCKLVRYIITAKNLFTTRVYVLEVKDMLSNLKTLGPLIIYSTDCPIELVATNHQKPAVHVINHKNILKPKVNPHKDKYT